MTNIILPTTPLEITRHDPRRLVLYGIPKCGKTEFCSRLPNNLIIDLEEGTEMIKALKYKIDVRNVPISQRFAQLNALGAAIVAANYPYKYITLDTASEMESWCEYDATRNYMNSVMGKNFNRNDSGIEYKYGSSKWESVLSLPNGGGYLWLRLSYNNWMDKISTLAPYIIINCHIKEKSFEKAGKEVTAKDLDLTGKIKAITSAGADAIGYMYRSGTNGEQLRISFQTSDAILCGARSEHLRGVDIEADWSKIYIDGVTQGEDTPKTN